MIKRMALALLLVAGMLLTGCYTTYSSTKFPREEQFEFEGIPLYVARYDEVVVPKYMTCFGSFAADVKKADDGAWYEKYKNRIVYVEKMTQIVARYFKTEKPAWRVWYAE